MLAASTLAGGLGVTIALVTLVDALMWRGPHRVQDPERLFVSAGSSNYVEFQALAKSMQSARLAAVARVELAVGNGESVEDLGFECVTTDYFDVLGVRPQQGRVFAADVFDDASSIIIDDALWRKLGRPALQSPLLVSGRTYSVIGVMPPGFGGFRLPPVAGWLALEGSPEVCSFSGTNLLRSADSWWLDLIGRLVPGAALDHANAEVSNALSGLRSQGAEGREQRVIQPLIGAQTQAVGLAARTAGWLTAGALTLVAVVVLNVSSLFGLVWLQRRRDVAVRLQLGAARARLAAEALAEIAMLVAVCTPVALLVARAVAALLEEYFPISASHLLWNARSMMAALVVSTAVAMCAALTPALHAIRADIAALQEVGFGSTGAPRSTRLRTAVVVMQVALAIGLTVMAQMFAMSVARLADGAGYDIARLGLIEPDLKQYPGGDAQRAALEETQLRLDSLPFVELSTIGTSLLIDSKNPIRKIAIRPQGAADDVSAFLSIVDQYYFATVGTHLLAGRNFDPSDHVGNEPVGIISSVTALRLWPSGDALGSCLTIRRSHCVRIVAISEPRRAWKLTSAAHELFLPASQIALVDLTWSPTSLLVRTVGPTRESLPGIRRAVGDAIGRGHLRVNALSDLAGTQVKAWRAGATLFGLFGWTALVLSGLGVYATFALYVHERRAELAVRLAVGAAPTELARLLVRRCCVMTMLGIALGSAIAYGSTLATRSLWFGTAPGEPFAFGFAAAVIFVAAGLGVIGPAIAAMRLNPAALTKIV